MKINDIIEVVGVLHIDETLGHVPEYVPRHHDVISCDRSADDEYSNFSPPSSAVPRIHALGIRYDYVMWLLCLEILK